VEVLGAGAFMAWPAIQELRFEAGSRLRVIGSRGFVGRVQLALAVIPSPVEVIEKRAFSDSLTLQGLRFEKGSRLQRIEEKVFLTCPYMNWADVPSGAVAEETFKVVAHVADDDGSARQPGQFNALLSIPAAG
jgi:hypothetical protein